MARRNINSPSLERRGQGWLIVLRVSVQSNLQFDCCNISISKCDYSMFSFPSKLIGRRGVIFVLGRLHDTCGCKCRRVKKNASFPALRFARNPSTRISFRKSAFLRRFSNPLIIRGLNESHVFLSFHSNRTISN